jgi:hypothetical protein
MPRRWTPLVLSLLPIAIACNGNAEQSPTVTRTETERALLEAPVHEDTTFLVHRVERRVGEERTRVQADPTRDFHLRTLFVHSERGERVALAATMSFGADGRPRHFAMWGKTSAYTEVDIDVSVDDRGQATIRDGSESSQIATPPLYFTAAGYTPIAIKDALIAFWHRNGRPAEIPLLPSGTARLSKRGDDVFELGGKSIELERLEIAGVNWGREVAWIDAQQRVVALMTNDALYSHMQIVGEGYEPLLGEFITRGGAEAKAIIDEQAIAPIHEGNYAITNARLVDGTGAAPIDDAVIVIADGKIVSAGKHETPKDMPILDARGRTVLPGLWDMHAHFEQAEWGPIHLAAGVTTVRDMGNSLSFLTGVRGGKVAPRILCAGLVDGVDGNAVGALIVRTESDIEAVLATITAAGCVQVKIYASFDPALVAPLAEQAHRLGLEVVGHMPRDMKIRDAVNAGFDMVSHTDGILWAVLPENPPGGTVGPPMLEPDSARAREAYAFLVEHGTVYDPTLAITELFVLGVSADPGLAKLPPELAEGLATFDPTANMSPADLEIRKAFLDKVVALIGAMHRAGVIIVAGSDTGVAGHSMYRELELYVQAGMSPMEAIQSATSVPARVMGLEREVGTIAPGMAADLILVDGDPLANISDLRKVSIVVTSGRAYETAGLWAQVGFEP